MGLFSTKDRHEFKPLLVELEDSPTSPLSRWLLWSLVAFMVLTMLWLYFAKIDVVVSGRGKVIPSGEIKVVQPIETGVVKKILVKEGELVREGQTLMEIDPSVTETNLESKQENATLLNLEIKRLTALIEDKPFETQTFKSISPALLKTQITLYEVSKEAHKKELALLDEQHQQVKQQLASNRADLNRVNQLLQQTQKREAKLLAVIDIIAKKEYESVYNQLIEYQQQQEMKRHELKGLKAKLSELNQQKRLAKQEYYNRLLETSTQKRKELTLLSAEIESIKFQNAKQFIKSPVDGYVGKLFIHTQGGVVTPAEKLISIIPQNAPLILKTTVLNQDIGFIKKDMNVSVKVDTYNFQKYGLIQGKVTHISDDAVEDEKLGAIYEVFVKPESYFLEHNGKQHSINSGMSITAEMKVGKRRVINFFIYPMIRYLDEGLSVR
jgi:hemolysin D